MYYLNKELHNSFNKWKSSLWQYMQFTEARQKIQLGGVIMDNKFLDENNENRYETGWRDSKKKRFTFKQITILVLIISIVGGASIGAGFQVSKGLFINEAKDSISQNDMSHKANEDKDSLMENVSYKRQDSAITKIAEEVGPSVVAITSKVTVSDWFNNQVTQEGKGSGVIFDVNSKSIMILTNNHVIDKAEELIVTFNEKVKAPATVMGVDNLTDLGIIKVEKKDVPQEIYNALKPIAFGDSDHLKVGETAIAIGNPLGYNNTVTVGVVSALNRQLRLPDKNLKLLQTDAAINPGNSGGALVNMEGELIGINTIKIADTKVEGIGFAIPINYAKPIIEELVDKGFVSRPYLGVLGRNVDSKTSELYEIPIGVIIVDVMENGAADMAGIKRGDVIIEVEGQKITSMEVLSNIIKGHEVGDKIKIKLIRNGNEKKKVTVKLKERNG